MVGGVRTDSNGAAYVHGLRPWMVTIAIFLLVQGGGTVWWAASIDSKVKDIPQLAANVSNALRLLADHGSEIQKVEEEQLRIRGQIDGLRGDINFKTQDRFTVEDAREMKRELREFIELKLQ